jgi:hypothetical protein
VQGYTLDQVLNTLRRAQPQLGNLEDGNAASEHYQAARLVVRQITAAAAGMAFLSGIGSVMFRAAVADTLPETARKAANVSNLFGKNGVFVKHPNRARIAEAWAGERFDPAKDGFSIMAAVKACRPAPNWLADVGRAVDTALVHGVEQDDILDAMTRAVEAYQQRQQEAENGGPEATLVAQVA